jgi:hypothetical protein
MWRPARLLEYVDQDTYRRTPIPVGQARWTCCVVGADLIPLGELVYWQQRGHACGVAHRTRDRAVVHCAKLNLADRRRAVRAERQRIEDIKSAPYRGLDANAKGGLTVRRWREWLVERGPLWEEVPSGTNPAMLGNMRRRGVVEVHGTECKMCRLTDYGLWLRDRWIHQDAVAFDMSTAKSRGRDGAR